MTYWIQNSESATSSPLYSIQVSLPLELLWVILSCSFYNQTQLIKLLVNVTLCKNHYNGNVILNWRKVYLVSPIFTLNCKRDFEQYILRYASWTCSFKECATCTAKDLTSRKHQSPQNFFHVQIFEILSFIWRTHLWTFSDTQGILVICSSRWSPHSLLTLLLT